MRRELRLSVHAKLVALDLVVHAKLVVLGLVVHAKLRKIKFVYALQFITNVVIYSIWWLRSINCWFSWLAVYNQQTFQARFMERSWRWDSVGVWIANVFITNIDWLKP